VPTPSPKTRKDENQEIVEEAKEAIFVPENPSDPTDPDPELSKAVQSCLDRKKHSSTPQ
jgi:hypothetical protein